MVESPCADIPAEQNAARTRAAYHSSAGGSWRARGWTLVPDGRVDLAGCWCGRMAHLEAVVAAHGWA